MTYDFACTITGAAGFVGRNLCKALMEQDDFKVRVFAVDLGGWENIAGQEAVNRGAWVTSSGRNELTFHEYNVHQPLRSDFLAVDAIYHFAGIANPQVYLDDPLRVMSLNLDGLRNMLERIVLWSAHRPRIVYSSTSEVYGKNPDVPFREDSNHVFGPHMRWCYAQTKLVGEQYLRAYEKEGINHTIFRFFNFVGPDIDAPGGGRVITQMVGDAVTHERIRVTAPGTQTRTFIGPEEFTVPLVRAMTLKHTDAEYWDASHTLNVGDTEEISMWELAEMIKDRLRSDWGCGNIDIDLVPRATMYGAGYDDVERRVPDVTRAREVLGWEPTGGGRAAVVDAIDGAIRRHLQGSGSRSMV